MDKVALSAKLRVQAGSVGGVGVGVGVGVESVQVPSSFRKNFYPT